MHADPATHLGDPAPMQAAQVTLATNNGDIGGGEIMLLQIAEALERLGVAVTVVAPAHPADLADAAGAKGLRTVRLPVTGRRAWMRALRRWDRRERRGLLWCNGLVPAVATSGHPDRIVHLHQVPDGAPRRLLTAAARWGALDTLVPSESMLGSVPRARVLPNWTGPIKGTRRAGPESEPLKVGFLGRLSLDKGVQVLAEAMAVLDRNAPGRFRLLLGGAPRFVDAGERVAVERSLVPVAHLVDRLGWVEPSEFLGTVDVLVVPSLAKESFGLVAAEAMAARVPVVVSDAGALPEVVGDPSLVVPAGDPHSLAAALSGLRDGRLDPATEQRFARWATHYSPEAGVRRVALLLGDLAVPSRPAVRRRVVPA
jgi:glycosyltransferase involved in cell wall biosynthesis